MIELGYMAKHVAARPEQLSVVHVVDICSVSNCISDDFTDFTAYWMHNEFFFFDSPDIIRKICARDNISMPDLQFFFYRGHDLQFDAVDKKWEKYGSDLSVAENVESPRSIQRLGFDVVTYSMQNAPQCSPLSCNYLASEIPVNKHCLIDKLDDAIKHLESGSFDNTEPGPFRIIEVNTYAE